jgi:hypothetical protein
MTEIEKLTEEIKQSTDYQVNKRILRERIQRDLHFTNDGGLFKASPELIAFVHAWRSAHEIWQWDDGTDMYIEDTYGNPIHITDTVNFYKTACQHYQRVMNEWNQQHAELKKIRKI